MRGRRGQLLGGSCGLCGGLLPGLAAFLFNQGLDQATADCMQQVSDEIQAIGAVLEGSMPGLDLSVVNHIHPWCLRAYGKYIRDASSLRTRFSSNQAFAGITCPMLPVEGGFVPDYGTRYLREDVPFNLVAVRGLAQLCGVETPVIRRILEWAQQVMGKDDFLDGELRGRDVGESFAPQRFGFRKLDEIPQVAAFRRRVG